jgi:hypothetical protein
MQFYENNKRVQRYKVYKVESQYSKIQLITIYTGLFYLLTITYYNKFLLYLVYLAK